MTVERFDVARSGPDAGARSPWWGVHASRYLFAVPMVKGRRVLDIACGTGYGLDILAAEARAVVGVDADWAAARAALRGAGAARAVVLGDGGRLPFPAATFDAVTSFETLEHLEQRDGFLAELGRVLRPGGVCILSTPNANYTQPIDGRPRNPFHVHEYTPDELHDALRRRFSSVEMLGQEIDRRFVISPFWDDQRRLPRRTSVQTRLVAWKILNRLPRGVGDPLARAILGQPLVPSERDYRFSSASVPQAPVLVAICRA
jgi:SAM-dependent methyltransferase